MKLIRYKYNVELIPQNGRESQSLVDFFWRVLVKQSDELAFKIPTGRNNLKGKPIMKPIGMTYDTSFFNLWTGEGFLLPVGLFDGCKANLFDIIDTNYEVVDKSKTSVARNVTIGVREPFAPRDYQEAVLKFLNIENVTSNKLVGMPTGTGKTMTMFFRMAQLNQVTVIILRPFLMGQWKRELMKVLKLGKEDILSISGGKMLRELLINARDGELTHKVYIISNKTFLFYLKSFYDTAKTYEDDNVKRYKRNTRANRKLNSEVLKKKGLPDPIGDKIKRKQELAAINSYKAEFSDIPPRDFLPKLGAGLLVIDEAHLDAHLNNTIYATMGNIPHQISLSATYFSSDRFASSIYDWTYNPVNVYDQLKAKKYIGYTTYYYKHHQISKWSYSLAGRYNHNKYETTYLMKDMKQPSGVYSRYMVMVQDAIRESYIKRRKDNDDKILIFFQSLAMVKEMTKVTQKLYPDLKVIKYTGEEKDDSILLDANIIFATVGKAAVGLDLKKLLVVINFISILSDALSVQILGRLRELAKRTPNFLQFVCMSIPTHRTHEKARFKRLDERTMFMEKAKYHSVI